MKLNFIQNLSDQVVRENYQLKAQLQQTRQQLKDYETEMLEVIAATVPHHPLALSPQETLQEFASLVRNQLAHLRELQDHSALLRQKLELHLQQQTAYINTINQLKLQLEKQNEEHEEKIRQAEENRKLLNAELEWQRQCFEKLTEEMSELKIDKLKLEESKRIAIEEIRITQKNNLIDFRQKNQEEHMKIQRELRRQLEMRDNTIRDMSKSLTALTESSNIPNSQKVLTDIFRSFQNYQQLSAANISLKQENQQLREEVKGLFNRLIAVQADLQEAKAIEYNLRSEMERTMLEKQQVERQLILRMAQIAKSQSDKEAMEQYYDLKWNSEYNKVKMKLEASTNARIAEIEKEAQAKLTDFQQKLREVSREREEYRRQIEDLKHSSRKQRQEKEMLEESIKILEKQIIELTERFRQSVLMSAEEIQTHILVFREAKNQLLETIRQRENRIAEEVESQRILRLEHHRQITEINQKHKLHIQQQQAKFEKQLSAIAQTHATHIAELQQQILKQMDYNKHIRSIVEEEFLIKLQAEISLRHAAIAQKEQELISQDARWKDKFCELENLMGVSRRKLEEEVESARKEEGALRQNEYHLHNQIDTLGNYIKCLQAQIRALEAEIKDLKAVIVEKDVNIAVIKRDLSGSRTEAEVLLANRKLWKGELIDIQRQFVREFDSLKKIHSQEIQYFKDRIRELEELGKRKVVGRRELQKLRSMSTQRESLISEVQTKEAQNFILQQTKDYYLAKLRQSESQLGKNQFRNGHVILTRRHKKNRLCTNEVASHRVMNSKETPFAKRRYAITSTQKHYNLSLSKGRLEESGRQHLHTMSSLG